MSKTDVALVGCRWSGQGPATDLYPDPDAGPLQDALSSLGACAELMAWDDPAIDWGSYSHVVISSTWDSVERAGEYLVWARHVAVVSKLSNPIPVIEWGFDKVHHKELSAAGVPIVPTTWVGPGSLWAPPDDTDFVVKPSISAGGRKTARYSAGDPKALGHVRDLQALGHTVMVQPYLPQIEDDGETDLIFLGGVFSHAIRKRMALPQGEGAVDRPWERMSYAGLVTPTQAQREVAAQTLAFVVDRLGSQVPYGRVDLIPGRGGSPLVLEAELIDPYLSLDLQPGAAAQLATALLRPDSELTYGCG